MDQKGIVKKMIESETEGETENLWKFSLWAENQLMHIILQKVGANDRSFAPTWYG